MNFIFDEMINLPVGANSCERRIYISAAAIDSIAQCPNNINVCFVRLNGNAACEEIELPAAVVKSKVDEVRKRQAMKFDQVVRSLSKK